MLTQRLCGCVVSGVSARSGQRRLVIRAHDVGSEGEVIELNMRHCRQWSSLKTFSTSGPHKNMRASVDRRSMFVFICHLFVIIFPLRACVCVGFCWMLFMKVVLTKTLMHLHSCIS